MSDLLVLLTRILQFLKVGENQCRTRHRLRSKYRRTTRSIAMTSQYIRNKRAIQSLHIQAALAAQGTAIRLLGL